MTQKNFDELLGWFNLPKAAERLSSSLNKPVTVEDIIQLAIQGHLKLSLYVQNVMARLVAPAHMIYEGQRDTYFKETWIPDNDDVTDWKELNGPYQLVFESNKELQNWLVNQVNNASGGSPVSGYVLSGDNGDIWQPGSPEKNPLFMQDSRCKKMIWVPCTELPSFANLIIQRHHIEEYESSFRAQCESTVTIRAETTYLNIIGAMLDLMVNQSPGGQPYSILSSQSAVISAMLAHHSGKPGISQRTLEDKFAAANRELNAS